MPALEWSDRDVFLVCEKACGLHAQGCHEQAALLLDGLAVIDPANAQIHDGLSAAYYGMGRFEESVRAATTALQLDPVRTHTRARRAEAYLRLGRIADAAADCRMLTFGPAGGLYKALSRRIEAGVIQ